MGRKGGGRAAFMRAAQRGPAAHVENDDDTSQGDVVTKDVGKQVESRSQDTTSNAKGATGDISDNTSSTVPVFGAKASAFLTNNEEGTDDDGPNTSREKKKKKKQKGKGVMAADTEALNGASGDRDNSHARDSDSEENGVTVGETRGQMTQRHKRELKMMKEKVKRLGKKKKDEAAQLEAELLKRHAAEIDQFDKAVEQRTAECGDGNDVSESLQSMGLDDDDDDDTGGGKRLTKAQRRKQQRAQQEAEREARIAAEIAELGETERLAEERQLKEILEPLGLHIYDIPPDGHCLYRSLEDQLRRNPNVSGSDRSSKSYQELREMAASYLRTHEDEFRPFVIQENETVPLGEACQRIDPYEAYCREIESTAAWGGHIELQALSKCLGMPIEVYSVGIPVVELGKEFKDTIVPLRVCYLRHAYGLGEHFNSVIPV